MNPILKSFLDNYKGDHETLIHDLCDALNSYPCFNKNKDLYYRFPKISGDIKKKFFEPYLSYEEAISIFGKECVEEISIKYETKHKKNFWLSLDRYQQYAFLLIPELIEE